MLNVPLGTPLTAGTSASLISHWASGPERIGLGADVVPWPQATASPSASTVRTTHMPLRIALLPLMIAAERVRTIPDQCPWRSQPGPGAVVPSPSHTPVLAGLAHPRAGRHGFLY